jgi:hypothetical protein
MAERKGSRTAQAREKARQRTAALREREQKLEDLATAWFEDEDEIEAVRTAARSRIEQFTAKVNEEATTEVGKLEARMTSTVGQMLELTGVRSVAERLDVPEARVREVKARADSGDGPPEAAVQLPPSGSVPGQEPAQSPAAQQPEEAAVTAAP